MEMSQAAWARTLAATGLSLLLAGALFAATRALPAPALAALFGAGGALVVLGVARTLRVLVSVLRGQSARRGADSLLAAMLFTAILVVVQATSVRHSRQFDLTRNRRHTLAPQTVSLLATLDRDVEATAFVRQGSSLRAGISELLDLYARRTPRFRFHVVDPDRHPDLADRLKAAPDEVVVQAGERRFVVRVASEQTVTSAILQVTRTDPRAVYFVTGHGEKDLGSDERDGYSALRRDLEAQGYAPRPLPLVSTTTVPADAAVVVVAGPARDYFEAEIDALRAYARAGGALFVLIDPRVALPHLGGLLADYGLSVLDAVILDEKELRAGDRTFDATVVKVRRYERHPIQRGFNYVTMYPRARPVFIAIDSLRAGVTARYLAISDETSWGETDMEAFARGTARRDGADIQGPLPVSAAAEQTPPGRPGARRSRVVLVGDSDFVTNLFFGVLGNADWFENALGYLSQDESMITIRPREATGDHVYLSRRQGRFVFAVCIVLLPAIGAVSGAVVIARRRRL